MATYIIEGKPGGGKTFHTLVTFIIGAIKQRRKIYHNIDGLDKFMLSMVTNVPAGEIDLELIEGADEWRRMMVHDHDGDKEGNNLLFNKNSLVVIDEAQMIWNSRDFKNTTKGFMDLLAYHRHFGFDFVFVTQDSKSLDAYVSRVCEGCWTIKNLGFLAAFMKGRYVVQYKQKPRDPIVASTHARYDAKYFPCYRTAVTQNTFGMKAKGAFSGVFVFVFFASLAYAGIKLYTRGLFNYGLNDKKKHGTTNRPHPRPAGLVPQTSVAVPLRDSVSDSAVTSSAVPASSSAPAVADPNQPRLSTLAEKLSAGKSPESVCYQIPRKGTMKLTMNGVTDYAERQYVDTVCP